MVTPTVETWIPFEEDYRLGHLPTGVGFSRISLLRIRLTRHVIGFSHTAVESADYKLSWSARRLSWKRQTSNYVAERGF